MSKLNITGFKVGGNVKADTINSVMDPRAAVTDSGAVTRGITETNITSFDVKKDIEAVTINHSMTGEPIPSASQGHLQGQVQQQRELTLAEKKKQDGVYDTGRSPGRILIINNHFSKKGREIPKGSNADRYIALKRVLGPNDGDTVENLFAKTLGLGAANVQLKENVHSGELMGILNEHKNHCIAKGSSYSVVVILSHGGSKPNSILMDDLEEIDLFQNLLSAFNHTNFAQFVGRPKIFFVQAFETVQLSFGEADMRRDMDNFYGSTKTVKQEGAGHGVPDVVPVSRPQEPMMVGQMRDIFVSRPCLPIRIALKESGNESIYIQSVIEVLETLGKQQHLKEMHCKLREKIVSHTVPEKELDNKYAGYLDTPCYHEYSFNKDFYF